MGLFCDVGVEMNNKNKDSKGLIWILFFLIFTFIAAVVGLFYSIYYEISGYNIDFLPDIGTPADFCGVLGTMLAIFLTWQQIKRSDEKSREDSEEARNRFQVSQERFNKTIEEMQKEREETYKPDLYINAEENTFSIRSNSNEAAPSNDKSKSFDITNIGVGTAKNIVVEAYSNKNSNYLLKYAKADFTKIVDDNYILYSLPKEFLRGDNIKPEIGSYLFPKDHKKISVPSIYLQILRDYIFELINKEKIGSDPYVKLPKFKYSVTYTDQEEIKYSKEVVIYAKCWDIRSDNCKVTLSVENKPAKKK